MVLEQNLPYQIWSEYTDPQTLEHLNPVAARRSWVLLSSQLIYPHLQTAVEDSETGISMSAINCYFMCQVRFEEVELSI